MVFLGLPALFLGLALVWFGDSGSREQAILTAEASLRDFQGRVDAVGDLDAFQAIELSSEISGDKGKIIFLAKDGQRVNAGQVLVKLDSAPYRQVVFALQSKVNEYKNLIDALTQLLAWEKSQLEREITKARYEFNIAKLDLRKLEKGDGPQNTARLEGKYRKLKQEHTAKEDYIKALKKLAKRGFANPTEVKIATQKAKDAEMAFRAAERQLQSYKVHVLPTLIEKARAKVNSCGISLEQLKKSGGFRIGKAQASLKKAEQDYVSATAALKRAGMDLEKTVIKAPIPGMVVLRESSFGSIQRKPRVGDRVWHNMPLLYLPNIEHMQVKTRIREVDLHKIKVGMPASVRVQAYPKLLLKGRVNAIGVLATSRPELSEQEKHFEVTVGIDDTDQRLRPGMTANVRIECFQARNSLTVPVQGVFIEDGRQYCFVDIKSSFEKREVRVGRSNSQFAEIVWGLKPAEEVALSRPPLAHVIRMRSLGPSERK